MSDFVILVRMLGGEITAIMDDDFRLAVLPSREDALALMLRHPLGAYSNQIVECDEL